MDENVLDPRFETNLAELKDMTRRMKAAILPIVRDLVVKHTDLSGDDLTEALAVQDKLKAALDYSTSVLSTRSMLREKVSRHTFISLGYDCLPRTLTTKYGVIKPRSAGRLTCPFDLCVHPMLAVIELLENDFAGYQEPGQYTLAGTLPRHKRLNILFNHDLDPALANDDFAPLMAIYAKRAENFRKYASRPNALFVANIRKKDADHIGRLKDVVSEKFPKARLVLLDTEGGVPETNAEVIRSPIPWAGYNWFMVDDFATDDGAAFEKKIIEGLADICF